MLDFLKILGYLNTLVPGTNSFEYDLLFQVAEEVMTIPHSNAGEERIFSLISKNKTSSRPSLQLDGILILLISHNSCSRRSPQSS